MGIHRQRSLAFDHEAWNRGQSKMLIYPQEPRGFWRCTDIFCPPTPPPIIVTLKGQPDDFVYNPYDIMASNGFEPLDVSGVKAADDSNHFGTPYQGNYQAAIDRMENHYAMLGVPASSSFQDCYHVSPVASPEASFLASRWVPPTYVQTPEHTYTWPSDYQTGDYSGVAEYQTAVFQPHRLPSFPLTGIDNWRYANGMAAMPTDSVGYAAQTSLPNFPDGSFASTHTGSNFSATHSVGGSFSSTFSSSISDNLFVPDAFPPRAFHNSTPVDSYAIGSRGQEMPNWPQSPESYSAPSSSASSAASQAGMDSDAAHSSSGPLASVPSHHKKTSAKGRKKLPDKQTSRRHTGRRTLPPPKPAASGRSRAIAPSLPSTTSPRHNRNTRSNTTATASAEPAPAEAQLQLSKHKRRAVPQARLRPVLPAPPPRLAPPDSPSSASPASRTLTEKDELLIQYKEAGMGYKEIKKVGGFSEAVSTLRGRYRTITKPKEARVRKPAWADRDVSSLFTPPSFKHRHRLNVTLRLLEQGVRSFTSGSDVRTPKIPWMRVAAYIKDNGGYHFGNSTCRKRWDELVATEVAAGKDPARPFYEQWAPAGSYGAGS
ncbi:hypothetical protein CONLIGDRAFT_640259 [Coniochaeta ligniaria NRRL 30616]|uniref:Myb-like domain-containing protein n=1 Tax=Coniochaeta ligniaria NRRL 30616 TaxID=1408157 RepID=A0A1J7JSY4_9PEZI|nr:hypothetical protein CONLIGDRAFT_640259 [Coniochaeta ligniaria NRRL 30616]